jgi:hypothetical protein
LEFQGDEPTADLVQFAASLDSELCRLNEDYQAHRAEGFGMDPPEIIAVKPGSFAHWMRDRGKLGGQHKVPRVINDQDLFAELQAFVSRHDLRWDAADEAAS